MYLSRDSVMAACAAAPWRLPDFAPEALLDAGFAQQADDGSLCRALHRLSSTGQLSVAVLGGSITFGHGIADGGVPWPAALQHALSSMFNATVRVSNLALPATTAGFAALCVDTLLRSRTYDLAIVEYAFNTAETSKLELLIRVLRERGAAVATLDYGHVHNLGAFHRCLHAGTARHRCIDLVYQGVYRPRRDIPHMLMLSAQRVPTASFRALGPWLYDRQQQPADHYASESNHWLASDGRHLSMRGHSLLAALALRMLWRSAQACGACTSTGAAKMPPRREHVPKAEARTHCAIGQHLLPRVELGAGGSTSWKYLTENHKPGLISTDVGRALDVRLLHASKSSSGSRSWSSSGGSSSSSGGGSGSDDSAGGGGGGTLIVHLIFLRSYAHMGMAHVACVGACRCAPGVIDAHNAERVSLEAVAPPLVVSYADGLHSCALRLTIASNTSSGEHKFKLTGLVLTPPRAGNLALDDLQDFVDHSAAEHFERAFERGRHSRRSAVAGQRRTNFFFVDGGRRLAEQQDVEQSVGLLFVVYRHRRSFKSIDTYVQQVISSSRQVRQVNPALPVALATNLALNGSAFDRIVSLNRSRALQTSTASLWEVRLDALSLSPFALTLALDATSFICSPRLHAALLHVLRHEPFDFAVNFAETPLAGVASPAFGPVPARMEDVLPHNFAQLVRRGKGSSALLRRWRAHMGEPGQSDDQVALRATLRALTATGYRVCDDELPRVKAAAARLRLISVAKELARLDQRPRTLCAHPVHVRVGRLTERILGFKSADKKMPGWKPVQPRHSRPIVGEVLVVHSGGSKAMCAEFNRERPRYRIISQVPSSARHAVTEARIGSFASLTNQSQCARATSRTNWHLAPRVCSLLAQPAVGAQAYKHAALDLIEPLGTFWSWMREHGLTSK